MAKLRGNTCKAVEIWCDGREVVAVKAGVKVIRYDEYNIGRSFTKG
jgi:hypothetical protein